MEPHHGSLCAIECPDASFGLGKNRRLISQEEAKKAKSKLKRTQKNAKSIVADDYNDIDSVYWHGVMGSVENEWYGTTAGSTVDVLIVQSNYPEGLEGVPVIVPARGAKWAFSEIYGRLAALQAAGAAPIIEAWLAGELPLTSFP